MLPGVPGPSAASTDCVGFALSARAVFLLLSNETPLVLSAAHSPNNACLLKAMGDALHQTRAHFPDF